ncbi:MAG: AAA family ATPase [Alphaproteobacteria bacterium]|nr:AAA family ATPase [Alphaproteobacteria bacterium]
MHNDFMAFVNDDDTARIIRVWADRQSFPAEAVQSGGPELFTSMLDFDAPPKFALVDFDKQEQPVQLAARLVSLCGPSCRLVAMGSANDVTLFRGMLGAGMADYLVKPITPEALTQTLLAATRGTSTTGGEIKDSKNIIFIGVRGGVGASALATNLAWTLSHRSKIKCALLDLDLQYGTSALAMDIEPGHGLRDVLSSPQRVDGLMIAGALVTESDTLGILSAEEPLDEIVHIDPTAIMALLKEMRITHQAIIIDMPKYLLPTQKRLLATAQEIVLVTEMSLVGIRDTLRIRSTLKNLGITARVTQVATKIGPTRPAAVDEQTFTKGTQASLDFIVPDDHKAMVASSNSGKMLDAIAPSSPVTLAIHKLAEHLMGSNGDEANPKKNKKSNSSLMALLFKVFVKGASKK